MIPNIKDKAYSFVSFPVKAASAVVSNAEGLQKAAKLADTLIDAMQKLYTDYGKYPILVATAGLRGHLKKYAEVISGLAFIGQVAFWVLPEEGKTRPAWMNPPRASLGAAARLSWAAKMVSRAFLLPATFIDSLKMLDSFSLITLGRVASAAVGKVPILGLVKDSLIVFSSFFSIASSGTALVNSLPKWNKARKKCNLWKGVARSLNDVENVRLNLRVRALLTTKCQQKSLEHQLKCGSLLRKMQRADNLEGQPVWAAIQATLFELDALDLGQRIDAIRGQVNGVEGNEPFKEKMNGLLNQFQRASTQKHKWDARLGDGGVGLAGTVDGYATAKLERVRAKMGVELGQLNALDDAVVGKARKIEVLQAKIDLYNGATVQEYVTNRSEVMARAETLDFRKMAKSWIAIANDAAKIAIICFAVVGLALAMTSFAWILVILGLALAVNGIGLFKFLYDEMMVKAEIDMPVLQVAAVEV